MEFSALYFDDRLLKINPRGAIGVVTLWSRPEYVRDRFREAGMDLDPTTSPIAVFGTLYGNGLRELLRNLLYNPQLQVLLICGHDRSGSRQELLNFFHLGLEPVEKSVIQFASAAGQAQAPVRIRGTRRLIDPLVDPGMFAQRPLELIDLGDPKEEGTLIRVREFLAAWRPQPDYQPQRPAREEVPPLPRVRAEYLPSNPRGHQIVATGPLEAWLEVVFRLTRFGRPVRLLKGERLELQNLKVVVEEPEKITPQELAAHHLDADKFEKYYQEFLSAKMRPDETYRYGHRLRAYFGVDAVAAAAVRLAADPEDRKAYFTLWDNTRDLTGKESRPCLVSVFFRKFGEKLTLTATFRTHNALDAWLMNFYGLMRLQEEVAARAGLPRGAITVLSHSISLDPRELDRALTLAGTRVFKMSLDPQGYFRVTLDGGEILVEHRVEDVTLKEYRGRTAVGLQHQLARDLAVSDINHAMYLGRQLAKAEMALKEGREYVQD
jgi:thymidylate synthase